jgi:lysophospholipase
VKSFLAGHHNPCRSTGLQFPHLDFCGAIYRVERKNVVKGIVAALAVATGLLSDHSAQAISETNFAADYSRLVEPFFETGVHGEFQGTDAASISYRIFGRGPASPTIVILPGRSESSRKYAELIYDLSIRGFSIAIVDHRGQGENKRLTALHDVGHVEDFNDYVSDCEKFVAKVQSEKKDSKLFLLAHSMGGTIGVLYMVKHPKVFSAVVLSSPGFEINTGDVSETYAYWGSLWKVLTGYAAYPVSGMDEYRYDPTITVERSLVTSSEARWEKSKQIVRDHPELSLGSPSYGWLFRILSATSSIESLGRKIEVPVTIFRAGRDELVKTGKYEQFCAFRPHLCKVVAEPFVDAQHEILQERDAIRDQAVTLIVDAFR